MHDDVRVEHDEAGHRWVARSADGAERGALTYHLPRPGIVDFDHTDVDEASRGRGVGGALVRAALADARARRLHVVPSCPFVRSWLDAHPGERVD